jgi:hypothetical protein
VWRVGDQVRHRLKPEWNIGRILTVQDVVYEGRPEQRLTIRFERAGTRTLLTAFAQLDRVDSSDPRDRSPASQGEPVAGPFTQDGHTELARKLLQLPEAATDPFASRRRRLEATLGLYRFSDRGSALLDWAAMQTGLKDPLSSFSRHELEESFRRFQGLLDQHLRKLVKECRKLEPGTVEAVEAVADAAARQALRRVDTDR